MRVYDKDGRIAELKEKCTAAARALDVIISQHEIGLALEAALIRLGSGLYSVGASDE